MAGSSRQFLLDARDEDEQAEPGNENPNVRTDSSLPNVLEWDRFQKTYAEEEPQAQKTFHVFMKIIKVFFSLIAFFLVLGGAMIAKSSVVLMSSQLQDDKNITLKENSDCAPGTLSTPPEETAYWTIMLFIAFAIPEICAFLKCTRNCLFRKRPRPSYAAFAIQFIFQTLHTIGLGIFVFYVLPSVDVLKGTAISSSVCLLPTIFASLSARKKTEYVVCVIAVVLQIGGVILWFTFAQEDLKIKPFVLFPVSVWLISFGWWENYTDSKSSFWVMKVIGRLGNELKFTGVFTNAIISVWKILLMYITVIIIFYINNGNTDYLFQGLPDVFSFTVNTKIYGTACPTHGLIIWQHPLLYQVPAAFICYTVGKYSCQIWIQRFSFALPLNLAVPMTMLFLGLLCHYELQNTFYLPSPFFGELEWTCPNEKEEHLWLWLIWYSSQFFITIYIWFPKVERMAKAEVLFSTPLYNGLLVDQSLALSRRREIGHDLLVDFAIMDGSFSSADSETQNIINIPDASFPKIYLCATMWHETREEMVKIFKSIYRLDANQCAYRLYWKYLKDQESGYYEMETHIFFDDAFTPSNAEDPTSEPILNQYVKCLIQVVEEANVYIHKGYIQLELPRKCSTPYGGRLEWLLPGNTKLIVHLKDKNKVRHRKRWSQVMYMYFILGYRLNMDNNPDSENTYLLALDGDVDFQPKALELLVDLMKRNKRLGAACGRIHPTGSGPMVWYQKFEYAIGHWLHKAAEHVIGCVLCSPGCFSLFRASALMDTNVLARYTVNSEEPRHYVQYDQGEDRWLCTLLLQKGHRVEYCAASDAYTHAPEGFNEFYGQRRRWIPSTMCNLLDLLSDSRNTVNSNADVSMIYIIYQILLFVGSIIGPGFIFLTLFAALTTCFKLERSTSFILNIIPILVFSIVCCFCKMSTQLKVAQILSIGYALTMVAVIVQMADTVVKEGMLSPPTLFLVILSLSFVVGAILHPLEFGCLIHLFTYYITIPSMYLLLVIFSVANVNDISWGTRENPKDKAAETSENKHGVMELFTTFWKNLSCCRTTSEKYGPLSDDPEIVDVKRRIGNVEGRLSLIEERGNLAGSESSSSSIPTCKLENADVLPPNGNATVMERGEPVPLWAQDKSLGGSESDMLTDQEASFWTQLIEKYLLPIEANSDREARMKEGLLELRQKCIFGFFMINAIFVTAIVLLQVQEDLRIKWPFGKDFYLEPVGLIFGGVIAFVLVVQFAAMLFHRLHTFKHILSSTDVSMRPCRNSKTSQIKAELKRAKRGVAFIQRLQHLDLVAPDGTSRQMFKSLEEIFKTNLIHSMRRGVAQKNQILEEVSKMTASAQEKFKSIKLRRKPGSDGTEEWDLITPLEDDESENALEHLDPLSHPNGPTTRVQAHEITVQVEQHGNPVTNDGN